MSTEVATCSAEDTLSRCAQLMWDWCCGSIPVVDDLGRPISIITDRDICMAAYIQGKPLWDMVVASAMSQRLFTINEHSDLAEAEGMMRRHGIRRLLVVNNTGDLVGILSLGDIIEHGNFAPFHRAADPLSREAIAETVAAVRHVSRPPQPKD